VMQVDDDVPHALRAQPVERALDERPSGERHCRLGDETSQRIETGAETGRKDKGGEI